MSPAIAAAALLGVGAACWPFTVDDAFIVGRYAYNFANGAGWAFNPGAPSDGVTGPLWLLVAAAGEVLGLDPVAAAKAIGLACSALAAALAVAWLRRRQGGTRGAWVAALLLGAQGTLAFWGVAGLETGLATLAMTLVGLGAAARPAPQPVVVGLAGAALAWLRPEAAPAVLVGLFALALRSRRAGMIGLGLAGAGGAGVVAFRVAMFGDPLPLSYHAKPAELVHSVPYVLEALLITTGVAGLFLAALSLWNARAGDRTLGAMVLAHLLAVVLAGGDWMPGHRMIAPVLPLYAILAGACLARPHRGRARRAAVALLFAVAFLFPLADVVAHVPDLRAAGQTRETVGRPLAAWLAGHGESMALVDVGFLGYVSGLRVVDLGGLTEPSVARAPGGHIDKHVDAGWLESQHPDLLVLHAAEPPEVDADGRLLTLAGFPVERRVAVMGWVRERMRVVRVTHYSPRYWYVVLSRR